MADPVQQFFNNPQGLTNALPVPASALQPPQGGQPQQAGNQNAAPQSPQGIDVNALQDQIRKRNQAVLSDPNVIDAIQTAFQKEAPVPEKPPEEYRSSLDVFKSLAPALAVLGGSLTKTPLMGAMKAATGAMQGFNSGDKERVELNMKNYADALKQWELKHKQIDDLQGKIVDKDGNFNYPVLAAYAAAHGNQAMLQMLATDPEKAAKMYLDYQKLSSDLMKNRAETEKYLAEAERARAQSTSSLDYDTLKEMADQYLSGDKSVMQNLGRGVQGAQNIVALRQTIQQAMKDKGMTGADVARRMQEYTADTGALRSVETAGGKISMFAAEANKMANQALTASNNVPRTAFIPFNKLEQSADQSFSDPSLVKLKVALMGLKNTWAKAINGGGVPHMGDKSSFDEAIYAAQDKEALEAGIEQMQQEIQAAEQSPSVAKEKILGTTNSQMPPPPPGFEIVP